MDARGITEMPLKLVIAVAVGVFCLAVLTQYAKTAERLMLRELDVQFQTSKGKLTVRIFDAQTGAAVGGATVVINYHGGRVARTLGANSNSYTFTLPNSVTLVNVRVSKNGYFPWEGEVALA